MGAVAGIEDPRITARPVHGGGEDNTPQVLVSGGSYLAHATPDQHRELAAAIRKASADITGETGEKP
jgi:hypothetical protein